MVGRLMDCSSSPANTVGELEDDSVVSGISSCHILVCGTGASARVGGAVVSSISDLEAGSLTSNGAPRVIEQPRV